MFEHESGGGAQRTYARLLEAIAGTTAEEPAWRRPEVLAAGLPRRAWNGRAYRGINVLLLWHAAPSAEVRAWRPTDDASDAVFVVGGARRRPTRLTGDAPFAEYCLEELPHSPPGGRSQGPRRAASPPDANWR